MPLSPGAASLIGTGAGLLGSAINAASTARQNRLQREWNEKMYGIQRADSLADWNMQNEYNSPTAQMARLKAAGLNPNLVYGHGADTTAGPTRGTDVKSWNPQVPQMDLQAIANSGIGAYWDAKMKGAQIDNLKANNTIMLEEAMNKVVQRQAIIAQTGKTLTDTEKAKFDLELANSLKPYQIQAAELANKQTQASTQFTIDENARKAAMNTVSLQQAWAQLIQTAAQTKQINATTDQIKELTNNARIEGKLKDLELGLAKNGIYKNDPAYARVLTRLFNYVSETKSAGFKINVIEDFIDEYIKSMKKP